MSDVRAPELALSLIRQFEGLSLEAYQDAVGVWTIGYGTTQGVQPGMKITRREAEILLQDEADRIAGEVLDVCGTTLRACEAAALISFIYNVGLGAFKRSTMLKLIRKGCKLEAAQEFPKWNKAGKLRLAGLTARRLKEQQVFMGLTKEGQA